MVEVNFICFKSLLEGETVVVERGLNILREALKEVLLLWQFFERKTKLCGFSTENGHQFDE